MISAFGVDHGGEVSKSINPKNLGAMENLATKIRPGDHWTNHSMSSQPGMWAKAKLQSRQLGRQAAKQKDFGLNSARSTAISQGRQAAWPGKSVAPDLGRKNAFRHLP